MQQRMVVVWAVLHALLAATLPAGEETKTKAKTADAPAALSRTTLPARGIQEAILTVNRFGRYAVTVKSEQGVSLQLVDRMAGPGQVSGRAGERDGRLDLFLDKGQYKIVAQADLKGSGTMAMNARDFTERNAPRPPRLVEWKPVEATLDDFTQLSWWIEISHRRPVALEAAGRNLADLRLWKDGGWLVDAEPAAENVQPKVGQPLAVRRLATTLEPGLYLLTAYGGPSLPWAEDSPEHPLFLRFGIPTLPEAGRRRYTVGPLGTDRYLVPGSATYFRIELPEARPAEMTVGDYDAEDPFATSGRTATVTKKSLPPVGELQAGHDPSKLHVVTVTAPAGQPYLLQHFESLSDTIFSKGGDYWLSTIHSGDPTDSVDATAIVMRQRLVGERHDEPLVEQVVDLDAKTGWARRCNLLEPLTVFVHVKTTDKYEVLSRGTDAKFRFEPFFTYRPARYKPPDFQRTGSKWDLDAGYYVLTVEPEKKGILDVLVRPVGLLDFVLEKLNLERPRQARPVRAAAQFPSLALDTLFSYHVFINRQPQVKSGLVLRALPLDLTEPLPLALKPAETVSTTFRAQETGVLRCQAEDGSLIDVSVDGGPPGKAPTVAAGSHTVSVKSTLGKTAVVSLELAPVRLAAATALPAITDEMLASLPKFPALTEAAPHFFHLDRGELRSFLVNAESPALYRLETTGLLSTAGNLRSRTVTSFLKNAANGVGRNFLIQSYLRSGDYQLSVSPGDPSTGHVGLKLARTPLAEGGALLNGVPARGELPAGQAIVYTFRIPRAGPYTVKAMGLGHQFRGRLEDQDGWPIVAPNGPADYTRHFEAGAYRLVVLPEPVGSRVVTLLQRTAPPLKFAGHGPHRLPLATRAENLWMEPTPGQPRHPDVWSFELPAPAEASLELTDEMSGELLRVGPDGKAEKVASIPPVRGWKGRLAAGLYRLEAACVRTNSSLPYRVAVWPEPLVKGLVRDITAPASVPVSVGTDSLVEISSFGSTDVRGRLYDEDGRLVSENDDRPGDWNFLLAGKLTAGTYRLQVDPVGAARAQTTIAMDVPEEVLEKTLAVPAAQDIQPGRTVHVIPLEIPKEGRLLAVAARSVENVGLSIEVEESGSWRSLGSRVGRLIRLETPLAPGAKHRLRLWSADRRGASIRLSASAAAPPRASESQLAGGLVLTEAPGADSGVAVAAVAVERPGLFRVEGGGENLRACSVAESLCEDASEGLVSAAAGTLWLTRGAAGKSAPTNVRARRVILAAGADQGILVPVTPSRPALCDLAPGKGGPILVTARSASGQPGVGMGAGSAGAQANDVRGTAIGTRSAVAVALTAGGRATARVWTADRTGEGLDVRVSQQSFATPARESASWGAISGSLSGIAARAFDLPAGGKRLRLAVGDGTVAVLSSGDEVASVHWAGGERFEETVEGSANRLTLLHTRPAEDRFTVETLPLSAADAAPALSPGAPFERAMERAGWTRLAVPASADGRALALHVRGADGEPVLVASDGSVARGSDLTAGTAGGTLLVPHGVGPLLAWVDRDALPGEGLWGNVKAPAARDITVPAVVTLEGAALVLRLSPTSPIMLHLRSATPAITRWKRGDAAPQIEAHPSGCDLDVYLPAGPAEIGLRALAGRALWGTAELTATPVLPTGEGLGPEVLLGAGGTRAFSFDVARNGPVGIGARADSDVVETTLWTSGGIRLGSGVVQMPQLSPGKYVLAIHAPAGSRPVVARPALAGIQPPSLDPPDEVIQSYVAPPEGASFSATRAAGRRVVPQQVPEEEPPAAEEPDEDSEDDPGEEAPHS
jgi:hypothetical protein